MPNLHLLKAKSQLKLAMLLRQSYKFGPDTLI